VPDHRFRGESKAAFLCECGASRCEQRVSMSGSDYDGLAGVGPVVADGHGPGNGGRLGKCPVCGRRDGRERRKRR
jgi:hypothetical protein